MKKNHITISIVLFIILTILNTFRIDDELKNYNESRYTSYSTELHTIITNVKNVSDSIFDNIINTSQIIDIFKNAHLSDELEKELIRNNLHNALKTQYNKFTNYGIQQLHFHLPNNESFLRFHKPQKYGDNLTKIRESVKYVNQYKKASIGFEEGKIFNGYRFVYPLFDEKGIHIGSVEISASLLSFKKVFEKTNSSHIDFILTKETVLKKVFESELKNYSPYQSFENFLIQTTIQEYDYQKESHEKIHRILNSEDIKKHLLPIQKQIHSRFIDFKLYTVFFIPLLNDFTKKEVGYSVIVGESSYFNYFFKSIVISYLEILFLSILIGYIVYKNKKCLLETEEKEKFKIESYTDELTQLKNRKAYNQKITEKINLLNRYDIKFSMVLFDIDSFKSINDQYGHKMGDKVLKDMSRLIQSSLRKNDYIFRIGGEEFIIILPHTGIKEGILICEKIRTVVQNKLKTIKDRSITISLGVTEVKKNDSEDSIFKRVDQYMYESKQEGKNRVTSDLNTKQQIIV